MNAYHFLSFDVALRQNYVLQLPHPIYFHLKTAHYCVNGICMFCRLLKHPSFSQALVLIFRLHHSQQVVRKPLFVQTFVKDCIHVDSFLLHHVAKQPLIHCPVLHYLLYSLNHYLNILLILAIPLTPINLLQYFSFETSFTYSPLSYKV